jgi:hypothetical protein
LPEITAMDNQNSSPRMLSGTCLCGTVEYQVPDEFCYALNCHCTRCRRATGAAFKTLAGIERHKLKVTKGEDGLLIYGDPNDCFDARCKQCGALLYSIVRDGEYAHVMMGTLVDDPSIRPSMHIFVAFKAPWYTITDELPQYQELE